MLEVNSVICIEKEIAADTLGGLFESTSNHFLPYIEDCTVELIAQLTHYYDGIRKSSLDSLLGIIRTMYELSNPLEWQPGLENVSERSPTVGVALTHSLQTPPLDQTVKTLIGHVLPQLFDLFETEDNKLVVHPNFPSSLSCCRMMKVSQLTSMPSCAGEYLIITLKILILA